VTDVVDVHQPTRKCSRCGEIKDILEFSFGGTRKRKDGSRGRCSLCRVCSSTLSSEYLDSHRDVVNAVRRWKYSLNPSLHRKGSSEWYYRNRDRVIASRIKNTEKMRFRRSLTSSTAEAKKHGHMRCTATAEEIETAFTGKCHVCGMSEGECSRRLHMDHDHETGKFRGWLCHNCNVAIGLLGDNVSRIRSVISYMEPGNG